MRPGEMECRSRLGDRVRWVPPDIDRNEMSADPVGIVIATKRHYPRSPDLALDLILVLFDEHISLGAGGGGFIQQWFPPEQIEEEAREPSTTEGEQLVERFWQEFAGEGPITDRVAKRMVEWVLAQPQERGERIERGWAYKAPDGRVMYRDVPKQPFGDPGWVRAVVILYPPEPSTTEEQPTAPGKTWTPAALAEWTPEQWADALDAARTDLMCAEDFEPSDVAHVMNICAQVLRRPREQGERIEGKRVRCPSCLYEFDDDEPREQGERIWIKPHELADLRDDANGLAIIESRDEDDEGDDSGEFLPATLIIHAEPAGGEDE